MEGFEVKKRTMPHYPKDFIRAITYCIFFGFFGIHRFYTGYKRLGTLQLLLFSTSFIWLSIPGLKKYGMIQMGIALGWWIIDLVSICFNRYSDKYKNKLDEYNVNIASIVLTGVAILIMTLIIMTAPYLVSVEG